MRKTILSLSLLVVANFLFAQNSVIQASAQLPTRWTKEVSATNALKEYPRPQMVRNNWTNLNGLWDYSITAKDATEPKSVDGKILVPYPIESALSGVKKTLLPSQNLWYSKNIQKPGLKNGQRALLYFDAVDYEATVFVNHKQIGKHTGGYHQFSFDITDALQNGENLLTVKVWDPTNEGVGPHGKQVLNPKDIYYTPSSGIWQTVWIEVVPVLHIDNLVITPNVDEGYVSVTVKSNSNENVEIVSGNNKITGKSNEAIKLVVPNVRVWSPEDPYLYDLVVRLGNDEVKSYFGMRKVSIQKDAKGVDRIFLNNKYTYNLGVLDQGFWPDGLYTAPTDEALKFDIEAIKSMGFNTIRKHIKIEPTRWYYWADKLGMMVWQDFVNPNQSLPEGSKPEFEKEASNTLEQLHNYPCITTWVLFNEKWGQYDQERLTKWVKQTDPSRLVNGHTGEILYVNEQLRSPSPNAWVGADMTDVHSYPDPMNAPAQNGKARVLGEFGGIGVFVEDHQWLSGKSWGYVQVTPSSLLGKYAIMNEHLQLLEKEGLSGSIYTQPFDVEGEQNGLMTYDREITKIPVEDLRKIHAHLVPTATNLPIVALKIPDMTDPSKRYAALLQEYIDGKKDAEFLRKLSMMAAQNGDKNGALRISKDYMTTWTAPYTKDQLDYALQNTSSTKDIGFSLLQNELTNKESKMDQRAITLKLMNTIFADIIDPITKAGNPDWNMIEGKTKQYGAPGEEMFLRAKTIYYLNAKDWSNYKPVAAVYIEKYGKNIKATELKMLQENLDRDE